MLSNGSYKDNQITYKPGFCRTGPIPKTYLFKGRWMTRKQVCEETGWAWHTVKNRIRGNTIFDGKFGPPVPAKRYEFRGRLMTIYDVTSITGKPRSTLLKHVSGNRILEGQELADVRADLRPDFRSNARLLTLGRRTDSLTNWARNVRLAPTTLNSRLAYGWPLAKALFKPARQRNG